MRLTIAYLLFIASSFFLMACDNKNSIQTSAFSTEAAHMRVVFLGDSLTDGYTLGKSRSYPTIIRARLKEEDFDAVVVNAGMSGDTTLDGLRRLTALLDKPVDVLLVALGTNDLFQRVPPAAIEDNLMAIGRAVRERSPNAVLIVAGVAGAWDAPSDYLKAFEPIHLRVAERLDAVYIASLLDNVAGKPELNLPDMVHPNEQGHQVIADNVWPVIREVIKK